MQVQQKIDNMKKIILLIFIVTFSISGYSQNAVRSNPVWGNFNAEENINTAEVKIYPNPVKSEIVTVEFNKREIKEISITNITGKEVFLKTYPFAENKKQIQLNGIPNGIYFMKIKTNEDKIVIKKLMVSKN
ncbi:hypothetical protein MASR2M47_38100 [Draconibacterium sp.]